MDIEYCTNCGEPTPYDKSDHIDTRNCYIEGSGQLCVDCHAEMYWNTDIKDTDYWING